MKLTQETLPDYFSIADASTNWFTVPTNTFDFVSNNSKILLVTIGDSWTWGSDISIDNSNNQYRQNNVYGHVLANQMGAAWLNLALSAQGNFWMLLLWPHKKLVNTINSSMLKCVQEFLKRFSQFLKNTILMNDLEFKQQILDTKSVILCIPTNKKFKNFIK